MVARTQRDAAVAVVFHRPGEPDDRRIAVNGEEAVFLAMRLIGVLDELKPGDRLTVESAEDLPAISQASHYS
jgi:hypothetical protein